MLLSDGELQLAIAIGELVITPPLSDDSDQIKAASIDLRLGSSIWTQKTPDGNESNDGPINDISESSFHHYMETYTVQTNIALTGGFLIQPGDFIITETLERIRLSRILSGRIEGRSRLARMGIGVHLTAPKIDPGFDSHITLELFHMGRRPIFLQHEAPICTLLVERLGIPSGKPYQGMFNT
jgi:dCTP deaminase